MVTAAEIGWGKYREYEGAFYRGKHRYVLPPSPTEDQRVMAVITATEGGHYDAYNGYDKCISTSGLIQWCEAGQYSVSDMLGAVADRNLEWIKPVDLMAEASGLTFMKSAKGRYRFFFKDKRAEVDRLEEQQQMFLLNSNGRIGTWDESSKTYTKKWAAAISSVWEHPEAQKIQASYTAKRLMGFAQAYATEIIKQSESGDPVGRAFKAAYLSFAANNPTWANRHLKIANDAWNRPRFTRDWLVHVLKELTFGPKVTIYPHRYKAIRPVLEKIYGVDLPDLVDELKSWKASLDPEDRFIYDTVEVQEALIILGFDIGPHGADGNYGNKTREAILLFEQLDYGEKNKVPPEHVDGMFDVWTAKKMSEVLETRGRHNLTKTENANA